MSLISTVPLKESNYCHGGNQGAGLKNPLGYDHDPSCPWCPCCEGWKLVPWGHSTKVGLETWS